MAEFVERRDVLVGPERLGAFLAVPPGARGLVIFAHGSGSSRYSPRNTQVALGLEAAGFATLLLDLLKSDEDSDRANVFDIRLLASRLESAVRWAQSDPELSALPIGFFGASTGAAAALVAAAELGEDIAAVVSRGGRPDLAGDALTRVRAPTLLIVGGADGPVNSLNRSAFDHLRCPKELVIVPRATHLFEEPGTLEAVIGHARDWFSRFLVPTLRFSGTEFRDRTEAGRALAERLMHLKGLEPVVLALPRGGVPVAYEVARALDAPLDIVFVRKLGAPGQPELGLGAVVDGANPQVVLNEELVDQVRPSAEYLAQEEKRQLAEIERRRAVYRHGRPSVPVAGRTAIVIDDGIATGGTVKAALQALAKSAPSRLVVAVPVAPAQTVRELEALADEVVVPLMPDPFNSVGSHYRDFTQTTDEEVVELLDRANAAPGAGGTSDRQ